jgi:hypothetical protein
MGDFADAAKKVNRLQKNLDDSHEAATDRGMDKVQGELRRALSLNESVARGVLIRDIRRPTTATTEAAHETVSLPEWAKYLEEGTGNGSPYPAPSQPPYGAIRRWFESPFGPEPLTGSITASTELVAESIAEEGTNPHPFIDPVWNGTFGASYITHLNRRAMSRALRRSF